MAKKIEKSLSWLTVSAICLLIVFGVSVFVEEILADTNTPSVTVGNSAPTMDSIILNGGNAITLTGNTYVAVSGTTTVYDNNGYADIRYATSVLFNNNTTTCGSASANANWCYYIASSSCATSSCSGISCILTCSANVWFIADPSTASSSYPTKDWQMSVFVMDSGSNSITGTTSQELNILSSFLLTPTTPYGTVNPGATSSAITVYATNTGNYHMDLQVSGVNMVSGGNSIAVGQQKYSTNTIANWNTQGTALTVTPTNFNVALPKPTATTSNSVEDTFWMINIPTSTAQGTYTGTNTLDYIWASS